MRIIQIPNLQCRFWHLEQSISGFGGNVTINYALYEMQNFAENVTGIKVPLSGHWIPEEQPDFVVKQLLNFFGGNNSTNNTAVK